MCGPYEPYKKGRAMYNIKRSVTRFWNPSQDGFEWTQEENTAYTAGLVLIFANREMSPQILLIKENPDDPEKFTQRDGKIHYRTKDWKCPIGRFNPSRDKEGEFDSDPWDTVTQEWEEETGASIEVDRLKRAPLFVYSGPSRRPNAEILVERISFLVTPHCPEIDLEKALKQQELTDVQLFDLTDMPNGTDPSGNSAKVKFSHVRRIVEFLEAPQSESIKWQAGIPDDVTIKIRENFLDYNFPRFNYEK